MHPCQNCENDVPLHRAIETDHRDEKLGTIYLCPHCHVSMWRWVPLFTAVFAGRWGWQLCPRQVSPGPGMTRMSLDLNIPAIVKLAREQDVDAFEVVDAEIESLRTDAHSVLK